MKKYLYYLFIFVLISTTGIGITLGIINVREKIAYEKSIKEAERVLLLNMAIEISNISNTVDSVYVKQLQLEREFLGIARILRGRK